MESIKIFMITKEKKSAFANVNERMHDWSSAIDFDLQCCYFSGVSGAHIKLTNKFGQSLHNSLDKQS